MHVCCGPCSLVPLRLLSQEGRDFTTFFSNANISTGEEYERRFAAFKRFAAECTVDVTEDEYDPHAWEAALLPQAGVFPLLAGESGYEKNLAFRQARCRLCYRFRFERLAAEANSAGYSAIATTLSISPYQFTDLIAEELERAADQHGLVSAFVDYRPWYPESVSSSRERGMYRQNFCGCRFSQQEAELERQARKSARSQNRSPVGGGARA